MYRTNDPRFRRRLNEIGQTLESANESAQSNIYIFGQTYVKPCLENVAACLTQCVDASCPSLNLPTRDRIRRQRGRARSGAGGAEQSFDFYDDWDDEENDGLLGWGNDEFDRLVAGGTGYGTITHAQPGRQKGMNYAKGRRKSLPRDGDPNVIPGSSVLGRLFGGRALRYKPSAAGLQEHPGARRLERDITEGEALLEETGVDTAIAKKKKRARSGTAASGETTGSYSSRGDIFPSDEEDDAVPLDDEFAMVLERRTTASHPDTESSSNKTDRKRGKRPSAGSRSSTKRTGSSRSLQSAHRVPSRTSSLPDPSPVDETFDAIPDEHIPTMSELKQEESQMEREEEDDIARRRQEAQKLAAERGLVSGEAADDLSSKEATPHAVSPVMAPSRPLEETSRFAAPSTQDESPVSPASTTPDQNS